LRADQKVYSTYDMRFLRHTMHNNDIQHHHFWDKEALRSPFAGIYTLKPRDFRRPRPRSNLRPLEMVYGFLCLCGPIPKCFTASRDVLRPRSKTVFEPVGARRASWSRVMASPPAAMIRSFAPRENRRAAMVSLGTSVRRMSSVTVPTWTIILESRSGVLAVSFAMRESDKGGRLTFDRKRR